MACIGSSRWHKVKLIQTQPLPQRTVLTDLELVKYSNSVLSILPIHGLFDTPKWVLQSKSHKQLRILLS